MEKYKALSLNGINTKAEVLSVYDGDTFTGGIEFLDSFYKFSFRISKIDTPEIRTDYENAIKSRNRFLQLIGVDIDLDSKKTKKEIKRLLIDIFVDIECKEFDKYGRVLCNVYKDNIDLGQTLIDENFACVYNLK